MLLNYTLHNCRTNFYFDSLNRMNRRIKEAAKGVVNRASKASMTLFQGVLQAAPGRKRCCDVCTQSCKTHLLRFKDLMMKMRSTRAERVERRKRVDRRRRVERRRRRRMRAERRTMRVERKMRMMRTRSVDIRPEAQNLCG